jgi:apolipoprotein N-acyltransferase
LPVAVLQNNISVEQEHLNTTSPAEIAQLYEDLGSNLGVGLLVLPEGAVNKTHTPNQPLLDMLKARAQVEKKEVLVGCIETLAGNLVNAAYIIGPDRKDRGIYVKHRLFPLLEFMPWRSITEELPESIKRKIPAVRDAFLSTKETQLLSSAWARIGASISTEIIYPRLIAQEVREGAGLLVNIADLSQFHNSLLNRQILAAAAFRAVENGRYVILSSNTGISAVIDPAGVIQSASLAGRRGTLVDTVQFLCEKTLFTKMWWL